MNIINFTQFICRIKLSGKFCKFRTFFSFRKFLKHRWQKVEYQELDSEVPPTSVCAAFR